jgi:hypothetical protein
MVHRFVPALDCVASDLKKEGVWAP